MNDDDRSLDPFVDALRARLDAAIDEVVPDLREVVELAHAVDPEAVSAAMVEEARGLGEVVPLQRRRDEPGLAPFVGALRQATEASLRERGLQTIPPVPRPAAPRTWSRVGVALGVAAALALAVTALAPVISASLGSSSSANLAEQIVDEGPPQHLPERTGPVGAVERPADPTSTAIVIPAATEAADVGAAAAVDEAPEDPLEGAPGPADADEVEVAATGGSERDRVAALVALDRRAQAAWQRGDLELAERLLLSVVERGGRTSQAELAFGDLFAIAHQRGGVDRQRRHWRRYLEVFPRGRFADDARAGLCRGLADTASAGCWRRYLAREPQGSHRAEAAAVLARIDGGAE